MRNNVSNIINRRADLKKRILIAAGGVLTGFCVSAGAGNSMPFSVVCAAVLGFYGRFAAQAELAELARKIYERN